MGGGCCNLPPSQVVPSKIPLLQSAPKPSGARQIISCFVTQQTCS